MGYRGDDELSASDVHTASPRAALALLVVDGGAFRRPSNKSVQYGYNSATLAVPYACV